MNFKEELLKQGIELSDEQLDSFKTYYDLLVEENKTTNLTRITSVEGVYFLHFYDSLMASLAMDLKGKVKLLDVGAGPGFPGIPLKIYKNNIDLTVIEATNKKVEFMKKIASALFLSGYSINHLRAEDFTKFNSFDYVTTRAVSSLKEQLPYTIPFLKIGGSLISLKGKAKAIDEIKESKDLLKKIGAEVSKVIDYKVIDRDYCLVVIKKIKETPKCYPKPISRSK